jgi:hypothetical protein
MKRQIIIITIVLGVVFIGWRLVRPMQIFVVSPSFERPVDTSKAPAMFATLSIGECATCHREFFDEWSPTIHSQAWSDPYFQVDWRFDGAPQLCKNCHIPLDRQQEHKVLGFYDREKWQPKLEINAEFDASLQHEGVTCNACHLREGKIIGVYGDGNAPHPVEKISTGNEVCVRCHLVSGKRWDNFFKFPPCGTVAEIQTSLGEPIVEEISAMYPEQIAAQGSVECHMPHVQRSHLPGGKPRPVRQHLWRGGHDRQMVKNGLTISFTQMDTGDPQNTRYTLTLANTGAAHYIPTGTPDRHLTVQLRVLDREGNILDEQLHSLKRTVMWRPFIVDLWDTRLPPGKSRQYIIDIPSPGNGSVAFVEARVNYHLLDETRRKRIDYQNREPIHYPVFQQKIAIGNRDSLNQAVNSGFPPAAF